MTPLIHILASPALREPLQACRSHIRIAAGYSALVNLLYLAPTIYMMQVYDRVVPTGGTVTLYWLTGLVATAIAVLALLDALRTQIMARAALRLDRLVAPVIARMALMLGTGGADARSGAVMRQFDTLRQVMSGPPVLALFDIPWTPLYVLVAFLIHPVLGIMVLLSGAVLVLLALANQRRQRRGADEAHDAAASAHASLEASLREAETVRALGMSGALTARHMAQRQAGLASGLGVQMSASRYNGVVKFVRMFMQSASLGVGAWLAVRGSISAGAIIAASVLLSRALQPVEQIVSSWSMVVQARQAMRALDAILGGRVAEPHDAPRTTLPAPTGHIALDRVVVRARDREDPVLKGVSFTLEAGQALGIVGASGAGKSTLARVLAGAILPDAGEVRLDGARREDWGTDGLGRHVGYMPQVSILLPGSVGDNICRFAPRGAGDVDAAIVRAAIAADVHHMILRLPMGYDTPLDARGGPLSAGQAQRVALARALYGEPRILILDEPNAALDAEGEAALNRTLAAAKADGTTIVVVTHRAAALACADMVLVLVDGQAVQFGPKAAVLDALAERARQQTVVKMAERA